MGFRERTKSPVVEKAETRLNGIQLIDAKKGAPVNYGSEELTITSVEFKQQIDLVESKRAEYNKALKAADEISNAYDAEQEKLNELCRKVLSGGLSKFGSDSDEYEQLGGTRKSDRKKNNKKPPSTDAK